MSTHLNFASKSSKGKILRAIKNFNGPFITPYTTPPNISKKLQIFCTHSPCESEICHIHSPIIFVYLFLQLGSMIKILFKYIFLGGRGGGVGFGWLNLEGDFVSYCFPFMLCLHVPYQQINK